MTVRLYELHRILKPTGSLYLHCDPTASHYLKIVLDEIFGHKNFRNENVWMYGLGGSSNKTYSKKHDVILFYSKSDNYYFDKPQIPATSQMMKGQMKGITDVWDIPTINNMAKERLGYPTQKPLALLELIVKTSSKEGDLVLDPFCGCGTTIAAAEKLKRNWVGIDITHSAIAAIKERFKRQKLNIWGEIEEIGPPKTVQEVDEKLIKNPLMNVRKEFEKFCVATVGGLPNIKMGADGGVDGRIRLENGTVAIISVKSGKVGVKDVRELKGLLNKKQVIGVFITRQKPTKDMEDFANRAGIYKLQDTENTEGNIDMISDTIINKAFPKIQILTLSRILNEEKPDLPYFGGYISGRSENKSETYSTQSTLDI